MQIQHTPEHRVVRGSRTHLTREEKEKMIEMEQEMEEGPKDPFEVEEERIKIENKFLVPKSKNFIETQQVKEYEDLIELWLRTGYPVHIIGPTGCGKTTLAMKIAEKLKKPAVWINGDEEITTTSLVGGYSKIEMSRLRDRFIHNVQKDKDIVEPQWVSNPLALAVKHGYTLIYNEFSRAKPEANNILLSVLEEGVLELPTKFGEDRYVKVHPNFNVILTSNNIEYAGVHKPQDALLDRLVSIHMDYYNEDTETKIVQAHSKISTDKAAQVVKLIRSLRTQLQGAEKPGTRPAIMIAQGLNSINGVEKEVYNKYFEKLCVCAIASKFEGLDALSKKANLVREQIQKIV
ncbi:MAG: gas vesicle protein GvpN [Nanoarchaeota archaeon]|nr:gas vesicle protein GvpN [Nanoarchaeota archaeon]